MKLIAKIFFWLKGWKTKGEVPQFKKYVAILAPHTSGWDFVYSILAAYLWGMKLKFLAKKELFRFPLGLIFYPLGGIPINRASANDVVSQAVKIFNERDKFILALAPEGTRNYAPEWKKGFYLIARKAKVPIVLFYLDYENKTMGVGPAFEPKENSDMKKDMEEMKKFYRDKKGRYPEKAVR